MNNTEPLGAPPHGNAYNIFILVLTVMSLVIMVALLLPLNNATLDLLRFYDNFICFVFLGDFLSNLLRARSKKVYFIDERGWLDLIGSFPSFNNPVLQYAGLLRLARLSLLARIARLLQGQNKKALVDDVVTNRTQYAGFITILLAVIVMASASVTVLNAESRSDDANIHTGWDAFWWSFVTITTVGYGDRFPVTVMGRIGAMFVMVMGIGIIGALASILASLLVGDSSSSETQPAATGVDSELAAMRAELASLRAIVERVDARLGESAPPSTSAGSDDR